MICAVSDKDADIAEWAQRCVDDASVRERITGWMISHPEIMTYYQSYLIVSQACSRHPELFIRFWDAGLTMFESGISYRHNFALMFYAELTAVDSENRFETIFEVYFRHLAYPKLVTRDTCAHYVAVIARNKPKLRGRIAEKLFEAAESTQFPEKKEALVFGTMLEAFEAIYNEYPDKARIEAFARKVATGGSPKARKAAADFLRQYCKSI